jgi:DNA polymerase/3'-5' exonuclease PolX
VVILEQMDYLFRLRGKSSAYGYAARAVARLAEPIREQLATGIPLPGISGKARALIEEVLATGTAGEYEQLLHN